MNLRMVFFSVAGPNAYPTAARQDSAQGRIDRPDAATLAFMEGVMRALAADKRG